MAYCKSCGAYIPDGVSACLACGYEENGAQGQAAAQQAKQPDDSRADDLRDVMERHRKLQQEKSKQWAEQEKARRAQQEENRRWAREEYAKRQAKREAEAEQRQTEEKRQREQDRKHSSASTSGNTALAALSYLDVLFAIPYFFAPQDAFARFHAKQGLRLFLFTLATRILKYFTAYGWILTLLHVYFIICGISNALSGKKEPLPIIGDLKLK